MATMMDVLEKDPAFSELAGVFATTKLDTTLRNAGSYTLFAPTDEAIAALSEKHLAIWRSDMPKLTKILKFHLVAAKLGAADLLDHRFIKTVEGQRLLITSHLDNVGYADATASDAYGYVMGGTLTMAIVQTLKVNGATITHPNIAADNGFIHAIDHVMIPWLLDFTR